MGCHRHSVTWFSPQKGILVHKGIPSLNSRVRSTKCIGSSCQLETGPFSHDRIITKELADGCEMILGHQEALSCHMHHKDGQLDCTGLRRDGLVQGQEVYQEHGCHHRRVTNTKKTVDTEEEV